MKEKAGRGVAAEPLEGPMIQSLTESGTSTLLAELLAEQQSLTVVDRFAQRHENAEEPLQARFYRDLIPLTKPGAGEQYAFEVDLGACSGCKACVSACHSLNGLDEGESWRDVGAVVGGSKGSSMQQTVTTACHHCADPACANGCPTLAYEKDADTGIVRHFDDQCIGCRYCELKCPYDVPKFNARLGIVRKCDMCHGRLAEGEAPACVQACPNEAIQIRIVAVEEIAARSKAGDRLLPGTVHSDYTQPSTRYLNSRSGWRPVTAGTEALTIAPGHFPLAWMLVMTQAGAGIVTEDWVMRLFPGEPAGWVRLAVGVALAFAGLAGSVFHLGRPLQAWRAFLGWRKSWLSREIIAFGLWAPAMLAFLGVVFFETSRAATLVAGTVAALIGVVGVFCSVKVYADTRRPFWNFPATALRFTLTAAGAGLILASAPWLGAVAIASALALDIVVFQGRIPAFENPGRRMAGPLRSLTAIRFCFGAVAIAAVTGAFPLTALFFFVASELAGRALFIRAVDEPGMPGGIAT